MKYLNLFIVLVFLFSCKNPESSVEKIEKLTILHLYGTPYERGYDYGVFMKDDINKIVEKWINYVEETHEQDFDDVVEQFFKNTSFLSEVEKFSPELIEEIKGIADGAQIDFNTIMALQMSEEIDVLSDELENKNCTSISIDKSDSSSTFLAQNMDPDLIFHGKPILLHITDPKTNLQSYVYTFPGLIGLNGLNSKGIGITCNSISMLNHGSDGLPVAFIVRVLLQKTTLDDAFDFIENVPVGIPQCFTIGGIEGAKCYECSANDKQIFYPFEKKNITFHTNFSIANRDFSQQFIDILKEYGKTVDDPYFCPRYFSVYDKVEDFNYVLNYENIKSILSSTDSEYEQISNENTYGSLIMELSKEPKLYIAPDRPDSTDFILLKFSK